jgi:hypothetical protein
MPSAACATTVPHGSTIIERPKEGLPGGPPDLTRRDHPCPVLDRAGAKQYLPVVAAGPLRELGRDGQDLGAGKGERAVELRVPQVVADRQTDLYAVDIRDDRLVTRRDPGRFGVDGSVVHRYVE